MDHIGDFIKGLVRLARRKPKDTDDEGGLEIEKLAEAIVAHGRMIQNLYGIDKVNVEVSELAFRFREEPRAITAALTVLQKQGHATQTGLAGLWTLS